MRSNYCTSAKAKVINDRPRLIRSTNSPHTRAFLRLGIASATLHPVTPVKRDRV